MEAKYLKYKQKYLLAKHKLGGAEQRDSQGDVVMTEAPELDGEGNIVMTDEPIVRPRPPPPPDRLIRYGADGLPIEPEPVPDDDHNDPPWLRYLNRQLPRPVAPQIPRLARQFAQRPPLELHPGDVPLPPPFELYPGAGAPVDVLVGQDQRRFLEREGAEPHPGDRLLMEREVHNIIHGVVNEIPGQIPDDLRNRIPVHTWNQLIQDFPNWQTMGRINIRYTIVRIIRDFLTDHLLPPQR